VIETARQVTEHPIPTKELPRRPGDSARLVASSEKIKRELGWKPEHDRLSEIVGTAWEWHRAHPNGYKD
jgi:UDP-glucose 4-epimerase